MLCHFGKPGFSHVNSGQAGFLLDAPTIGLHTDRTWLSQRLDRYQTAVDPQPNWRLAESNIRYDARLEQQADWSASLEIGRWGSAPWNTLVERPIPSPPLFHFAMYIKHLLSCIDGCCIGFT